MLKLIASTIGGRTPQDPPSLTDEQDKQRSDESGCKPTPNITAAPQSKPNDHTRIQLFPAEKTEHLASVTQLTPNSPVTTSDATQQPTVNDSENTLVSPSPTIQREYIKESGGINTKESQSSQDLNENPNQPVETPTSIKTSTSRTVETPITTVATTMDTKDREYQRNLDDFETLSKQFQTDQVESLMTTPQGTTTGSRYTKDTASTSSTSPFEPEQYDPRTIFLGDTDPALLEFLQRTCHLDEPRATDFIEAAALDKFDDIYRFGLEVAWDLPYIHSRQPMTQMSSRTQ
jgi:hypothetical protein